MKNLILAVALCVSMASCATSTHNHNVAVQVYAEQHSSASIWWVREVEKKYVNAVVVFIHGTDVFGLWMAVMPDALVPMGDLVRATQRQYPGKFVVLISCNPAGTKLPADITGVAYALKDVWLFPDNISGLDYDALSGEDSVGTLDEFITQ